MVTEKKNNSSSRRAFETEALPHIDALHRTALRMTKNANDADDLVQEAYIKAYRNWNKFEPGTNCRAWLFRIMTNIFINEYRSKSRSPVAVNVDEIDDSFLYGQLTAGKHTDNPEEELFARILDDDVKKAIDELPTDFRVVIVLSFIEGFSYQEIADIMDLQLGTVKSRLHRGRKLLQMALYEYAVNNGYVKDTMK
ncbi:MAG: RNA polymerase subunit sigma [Candidatus Zixiibacteriota bacterium]|nr:MAG: RNA polymerase subunit sigma [candidate division Zixibacteria bacterium]